MYICARHKTTLMHFNDSRNDKQSKQSESKLANCVSHFEVVLKASAFQFICLRVNEGPIELAVLLLSEQLDTSRH